MTALAKAPSINRNRRGWLAAALFSALVATAPQAGVVVIDEPDQETLVNDRRSVRRPPAMAATAIIFDQLRTTAPTHAGPRSGSRPA